MTANRRGKLTLRSSTLVFRILLCTYPNSPSDCLASKWFWGADAGAPCPIIIMAARSFSRFMGIAEADACAEVKVSLEGECPKALLSMGEPTIEDGEVKVRSSMNILSGSVV